MMESYVSLLSKTPLFTGIAEREVEPFLQHMGARRRHFGKGGFVFYAGDDINTIGIVLSGQVHIVQEDYWGNRNILTAMQAGQFFGEAFATLPEEKAIVDVIAVEDTDILFIHVASVIKATDEFSLPGRKLVHNLLCLLAQKNLLLTKKIRYISQRSTRHKLMAVAPHCRNGKASSYYRGCWCCLLSASLRPGLQASLAMCRWSKS